jgi:hypothetical protein
MSGSEPFLPPFAQVQPGGFMLIALPLALLGLVVNGAPLKEPVVPAAPSGLRSALSQPSAWQLPEPEDLRVSQVKPGRSAAPRSQRSVARHGAATKVGAAFVGALLGFYVGGTVGGAMDKSTDSLAGALIGGFGGAAAGAIGGVLLVR